MPTVENGSMLRPTHSVLATGVSLTSWFAYQLLRSWTRSFIPDRLNFNLTTYLENAPRNFVNINRVQKQFSFLTKPRSPRLANGVTFKPANIRPFFNPMEVGSNKLKFTIENLLGKCWNDSVKLSNETTGINHFYRFLALLHFKTLLFLFAFFRGSFSNIR